MRLLFFCTASAHPTAVSAQLAGRLADAMVCACAELVVCLAAFASDEPKEASDEPKKASDEPTAVSARNEKEAKEAKKAEPKEASEPKKPRRPSGRVRARYNKRMRQKRAEEAALALFPALEIEPFHVDMTGGEISD